MSTDARDRLPRVLPHVEKTVDWTDYRPVSAMFIDLEGSVALLSRISSLSALVAAASAPVVALLLGHGMVALAALFMAALIFQRHRANIARLLSGTEPKIGRKG